MTYLFYWIVLLLSVLCLAYILLGTFAVFVSDHLIFPTPKSSYVDNNSIIKLKLPSGEMLSASYLPNPEATYTILFSHGNGEDIGEILPILEQLRDRGYSVFVYDYPGYGTSTGKTSEQLCYDSIQAAYEHLIIEQGIPADRIILYGRSLGSGPSTELASKQPVAGVIYEGAYTSTFRVMTRYSILFWDKFDNLSKLDSIHVPILIIHGTKDRTVPLWHGKKLFKNANDPRFALWVKDAGHNDVIDVAGEKYYASIASFVKKIHAKQDERTSVTTPGL